MFLLPLRVHDIPANTVRTKTHTVSNSQEVMKKRVISVLGSSPQQQCLVFGGSVTAGAYSPSVDVVMGLVSGMDSETGRTVPWCGEGARTGVKWPGTFPTT